MLKDSRHLIVGLYFVIAILLATVFAIDCLLPLRVAIWVFYVLPVVLCLWADRPAVPVATASVEAQALTSVIIINVPVAMSEGAALAPEVIITSPVTGSIDAEVSLTHLLTADVSLDHAISAEASLTKALTAEVALAHALVAELVS
jgi:hypothetical protein